MGQSGVKTARGTGKTARRHNGRSLDAKLALSADLSELKSDRWAARLFADKHGHTRLRYCPEIGWLVWTGKQWQRDDDQARGSVMDMIGVTLRREAAKYKDPAIAEALFKRATKYESVAGANDILTALRDVLTFRIAALDVDPYTLNCQNCTVNLRMFEVAGDEAFGTETSEHRRDDALTKIAPTDYAPMAKAPTWDRFLADTFPDPDVRAFVQRAVGYSITGSTHEQKFFICHGTGSNGKSTFLSALQFVLGPDYAQTALPQTFLAGRDDRTRSDIAALRGVRLLTVIETGDGKRLAEDLVKAVTGGDRIRCRFLYREFFEYLPTFKLWLATNHRPRITGTDHAIWRRVLLIPFTTTIPDDRADASLPDKLRAESEGILAWAVQGFREYCKAGLNPPEVVRAATSKYRSEEDRVGAFLAECCTVGAALRSGKAEMYDAYKRWCEVSGEHPVSQRKLSGYLADHGLEEYRTTGGKRCWIGVGMTENA